MAIMPDDPRRPLNATAGEKVPRVGAGDATAPEMGAAVAA